MKRILLFFLLPILLPARSVKLDLESDILEGEGTAFSCSPAERRAVAAELGYAGRRHLAALTRNQLSVHSACKRGKQALH